jgi:hypothetical protein
MGEMTGVLTPPPNPPLSRGEGSGSQAERTEYPPVSPSRGRGKEAMGTAIRDQKGDVHADDNE